MATSTIRFAIIVVLVVVGATVIARFPQATKSAAGASSPPPTPTGTPSTTGGGQGNGSNNNGGGTTQGPTTALQGVKVAVYNGTTQTGLAADVAASLVKRFGVKVDGSWILNAPSVPVDLTTIYFVTSTDRDAASTLADSYFKKLQAPPKAQRLPDNATVPAGVQIAVYLGTDYVNAAG